MQMPGFTDEDSVATNFMMKVLDEELSLEIRTRRSLSYAVYSYVLDYQILKYLVLNYELCKNS